MRRKQDLVLWKTWFLSLFSQFLEKIWKFFEKPDFCQKIEKIWFLSIFSAILGQIHQKDYSISPMNLIISEQERNEKPSTKRHLSSASARTEEFLAIRSRFARTKIEEILYRLEKQAVSLLNCAPQQRYCINLRFRPLIDLDRVFAGHYSSKNITQIYSTPLSFLTGLPSQTPKNRPAPFIA